MARRFASWPLRAAFVVCVAAGAGLAGGAAAQALPLPESGDCDAVAAGGGAVWQGEFSGTRRDEWDARWPVYVRGCFPNEYLCRRWLNEVQTAVVEPPAIMRCGIVGRTR